MNDPAKCVSSYAAPLVGDDTFAERTLGGFRLVEERGRGAFATVYRARQVRLERDVAVKVLDPVVARNPDAARRFDREGSAAAGLDHPNIVPVYEAGDEDGVVYLAMRFVNGRSFAEELTQDGTPSPARAVAVVRAVGLALDHAHSRGVLHRDVKPANILTEGERVWLADFGIAATVQTVGAYTSGAIGTMQYMAPEQARPGEADGRADLYALGCVAYECVAGHPPFAGTEMAKLLYAHAHDAPPPVGDAALDAFLYKALAKAPNDRFATGEELASAFADALGVEEHEWEQLARPRPQQRRRAIVVAAAVALVVAAAAGYVLTRPKPIHYVAAAPNLHGPLNVRDDDGATYALPSGWSISARAQSTTEHSTVLVDGDVDAMTFVTVAAQGRTVAGFAATAPEYLAIGKNTLPACPVANQHPTTIGGVHGVRCQFRPTGVAASASNEVVVYFAVVGDRAWLIEQHPNLDATRLAHFLDGLKLT